MAVTQKQRNAGVDVGKGSLYVELVARQTSAAIVEINMMFLKKLKIELPPDPARPFLGVYSKESLSAHHRDTCSPWLPHMHAYLSAIPETRAWRVLCLVSKMYKSLLMYSRNHQRILYKL